ncbi:MAG: DMT family transporter, partial [Myxococcales bacterium]|nr:DMT family transporter [Myxococcales bacterium]
MERRDRGRPDRGLRARRVRLRARRPAAGHIRRAAGQRERCPRGGPSPQRRPCSDRPLLAPRGPHRGDLRRALRSRMMQAVAPRVALALLGALIALSFAAPLFRLAAPTHPLVAAGLRLSLAALILSPLIVRAHRAGRLDRRTVRLALLAGLAYGLHFGAWVTSLTLTSVAASVTLVTCTPLLLAIWAAITGEDRQGGVFFVALGCSILGLVIIGGADLAAEGALVGDALALFGALAIAGYFLLARRLGPTLDVGAFSAIATATGGLSLLTAAAFMGVELRPASVSAAWAIALCTL